jgi:hypothetical protein
MTAALMRVMCVLIVLYILFVLGSETLAQARCQ